MYSPEAQAFSDLLAEEREAAAAADITRLVQIQELKGDALTRLRQCEQDPEIVETLSGRALENIALMRHLVSMLRAMLNDGEEATYGGLGQRVEPDIVNRRGTL